MLRIGVKKIGDLGGKGVLVDIFVRDLEL